jgi:hypothetical protein
MFNGIHVPVVFEPDNPRNPVLLSPDMNNADNTLEILIKLGFIGADQAGAARAAIAGVKDETKAGGTADANAAKDTDKLTASKREMLHLLHGMPPEFRQAGYSFIQGFYNPMFAGMTALTGLFLYAKKQLDDYNKSLDEIGINAAKADFLPGIEAKMEVLRNGAADMQKWLDTLAQEQSGEEGVAKALADQLGLMLAIATVKGALAKAEEALAIAKIKQGQASGRISPADAERQITEAQAKAVADEQRAKEKQRADTLGTKSFNLMGLEGIQKIIQPIAEAAKQAQTDEDARQARLKADAGTFGPKMPVLKEASDKTAAQLEYEKRMLTRHEEGTPGYAFQQGKVQEAQGQFDKAQAAIAQLQKILNAFAATQTPEAIAAATGLKDARERAVKQPDETAKAIGDLKIANAELAKNIATLTGPERAVVRAKQQTIYTEGITTEENRARADAKTLGEYAGRPSDSLSPADIAKIKAAIEDRDAALADAAAMISELAAAGEDSGQIAQFRADLREMRRDITAIQYSK